MNFWHLVKVVRSRLVMILGLAAATILVIYVAVPKPMVVYPAWCKVSPTAQVMQGNITTAVPGGQITSIARNTPSLFGMPGGSTERTPV